MAPSVTHFVGDEVSEVNPPPWPLFVYLSVCSLSLFVRFFAPRSPSSGVQSPEMGDPVHTTPPELVPSLDSFILHRDSQDPPPKVRATQVSRLNHGHRRDGPSSWCPSRPFSSGTDPGLPTPTVIIVLKRPEDSDLRYPRLFSTLR